MNDGTIYASLGRLSSAGDQRPPGGRRTTTAAPSTHSLTRAGENPLADEAADGNGWRR